MAVKSFPGLNKGYASRVGQLRADAIVILDKPVVEPDFFQSDEIKNMPVIWLDHHNTPKPKISGVQYYNSFNKKKKLGEPITYICHKITRNKQDAWLALAGCIGDHFIPDFANEACVNFPELWHFVQNPSAALYETDIGRIARMFSFALKDKTSNVIKMLKFLYTINSPYDILNSDEQMIKRYEEIDNKYQKLLGEAKSSTTEKLLFFEYSGDLSISADISNELSYFYPNLLVVVCYLKGEKVNISIRGERARDITLEAIRNIESATGGGHENATGAQVPTSSLAIFRKRIEDMVNN